MTPSWTIGDRPDAPFRWIHIDGRNVEAMRWLEGDAHGLPETARFNLTTAETRPRCQPLGDGVIINLRGPRKDEAEDGDALVSVRIWAERGRVVSVSYRRMAGLGGLRQRMEKGEFLDPGDFIAALSIQIARHLDPVEIGRAHV